MASFKSYENGLTIGRGGRGGARPTKRGAVTGWTRDSVRRHKAKLYAVEVEDLDGIGVGITLTLRRTPATQDEWSRLVKALLQRLRVAGFTRWHWVVEWQRRGTPHLHMAVYVGADWTVPSRGRSARAQARSASTDAPDPDGADPDALARTAGRWVVDEWLRLAVSHEAGRIAQEVVPITGPAGWLKYLSKHASRGVAHYQRQGRPPGWTKTGRLYGFGGSWPMREPLEGKVSEVAFWRVRRLVRGYVIADARSQLRAAQDAGRVEVAATMRRRLVWSRHMLRHPDRAISSVRGVSEWVPGSVSLRMVEWAGWDGTLAEPGQREPIAPRLPAVMPVRR
ncbi:hypothetical protein [Nocardioides sp.]|uniref:rolling circle replication-associated protein n=1 Tax=Nocardioides sp. TaxID=35761 RepID=UPI0039E5889F